MAARFDIALCDLYIKTVLDACRQTLQIFPQHSNICWRKTQYRCGQPPLCLFFEGLFAPSTEVTEFRFEENTQHSACAMCIQSQVHGALPASMICCCCEFGIRTQYWHVNLVQAREELVDAVCKKESLVYKQVLIYLLCS